MHSTLRPKFMRSKESTRAVPKVSFPALKNLCNVTTCVETRGTVSFWDSGYTVKISWSGDTNSTNHVPVNLEMLVTIYVDCEVRSVICFCTTLNWSTSEIQKVYGPQCRYIKIVYRWMRVSCDEGRTDVHNVLWSSWPSDNKSFDNMLRLFSLVAECLHPSIWIDIYHGPFTFCISECMSISSADRFNAV